MKVLIIGDSVHNDRVSGYFAAKGMIPVVLSDVKELRSLSGEAGAFTAHTKDLEIKTDFVVLTQQPAANPVIIDGLQAFSLYGEDALSAKPGIEKTEPVIFLLDYVSESPAASTIQALSSAVAIARGKRQVYYLAKFIRTSGRGIESLYKEARSAGVIFIKYENLYIKTDISTEEFTFSVTDGVFKHDIKTKIICADGGPEVGDTFSYAVKKLNLTANIHGYITEDMYNLSPVLTSRRGVYYITRDLTAERLEEGLEYIYTLARSGIWDKPSHGSAVIDGKKCVLCYTCYRACPHAALTPDPGAGQMMCLDAACAGCGICTGLCPANAIVQEKDVPRTMDRIRPGKLLVLYCENSGGATLLDIIALPGDTVSGAKLLPVPCGGMIDRNMLSDGLEAYKKVIVVVCPDGACRHFDGGNRACVQVKRQREMLEAAGLTPERIGIIRASQAMPNVFWDELEGIFNDNC